MFSAEFILAVALLTFEYFHVVHSVQFSFPPKEGTIGGLEVPLCRGFFKDSACEFLTLCAYLMYFKSIKSIVMSTAAVSVQVG